MSTDQCVDNAPPGQAETLWSLPADWRFRLEPFEENFLLFNLQSGGTHVVNELVAAILDALRGRKLGATALAVALGLDPKEGETAARIEGLLLELDMLGLIQPAAA